MRELAIFYASLARSHNCRKHDLHQEKKLMVPYSNIG